MNLTERPERGRLADIDPVVSLEDSAKIANESKSTLIRRAKAGKLTVLKLSARRRGIRASELARYIDQMETVA